MLNRRGFLGSLIGIIALTNDFFAQTDDEPWQRVVLPYRMLFKGNGVLIQAPGVAKIVTIGNEARFLAEPLTVSQTLVVDRCILLTESGRVISDRAFNSSIAMTNGDKLVVTSLLTVNGADKMLSVEEIVDLFLKKG